MEGTTFRYNVLAAKARKLANCYLVSSRIKAQAVKRGAHLLLLSRPASSLPHLKLRYSVKIIISQKTIADRIVSIPERSRHCVMH